MTEEHCWGHYDEKDKCVRLEFFCEDAGKCFVYTKRLRLSASTVRNQE